MPVGVEGEKFSGRFHKVRGDLVIGIDHVPPHLSGKHQAFLRAPVVGDMYHVHPQLDTVLGELPVPLGLTGVDLLQFIRIHGHPAKMILYAEGPVQGLENTVGLHIAEPASLRPVMFQRGLDILIILHVVHRKQGNGQQSFRRDLSLFLPDFLNGLVVITGGAPKDMGHIKLIVILKILHRTKLTADLLREIRRYPAIQRGSSGIFPPYGFRYQFIRLHAVSSYR